QKSRVDSRKSRAGECRFSIFDFRFSILTNFVFRFSVLLVLALAASPAFASVSATTKTCAALAGSTPVTSEPCTWSSNPASGEFVGCLVSGYVSGLTYSVTDSNSDAYSSYGSQYTWAVGSSTTAYVQVFYFKLTTSISTTTFQLSGSGAAYAAIQCDTAAGVNAVGKDGQSSATTSSGGVITAGSITPSITGDYLFCGAASQGSSTLSTGSGFTAGASPATNLFNEYQVLSSASSITPTMDISGGTYAGMVCSA